MTAGRHNLLWLFMGLASAVSALATSSVVAAPQDFVKLTNVGASDKAVVLLDGRFGDECTFDSTYVYPPGGPLSVGDIRQPTTTDFRHECYGELAVFAHKHAAYLDPDFEWTSDVDHATVALRRRVTVKVTVHVVPKDAASAADARERVESETLLTSGFFEQNRAGLAFQWTVIPISPNSSMADTIGLGCQNADDVVVSKNQKVHTTGKTINVYYVPSIKMPDLVRPHGYTCFEWGASNVVYMSLSQAGNSVLAHELGHVFSLRYDNGHVSDSVHSAEEFGATNLMQEADLVPTLNTFSTFTLGQVYRMNFDGASWLNTSGTRTGPTRMCQDRNAIDWPCPKLAKAFP